MVRHLGVFAGAVGLAFALGCGSSSASGGSGGASSDDTTASSGAEGTGTPSAASGPGATTSTGSGGSPAATCPAPIAPADVSKPTTVVGTGTAASCTEAALEAAVTKGGVVTFDCGADPLTITVTSEKAVANDTTIDGGGKITLSGGGTTRILHVTSAWNVATPKLTVQNLAFTGGFVTAEANTMDTSKGGGAIFREGGSLDVIDCTFTGNQSAESGQDVSGGAITSQGIGETTIVGSTFSNNSASNGGAVGNLGNILTIVNDTFDSNEANGNGGNPGNGGNGGAVVFDGAMTTMTICGSTFTNNTANAQGGALFRVAYSDETTTIDRCTFDSNSADPTMGLAGAIYLEDTTIDMTATTISNNKAHYGGGFWIGHAAIANITNVTIANNVADQGGGVWIAGMVSGTFLNVTMANNTTTPGGYAPGIFSGMTGLVLTNTIVDGGGCKDGPVGASGANIQYPDMGQPCTNGSATIADPMLGALMDNGGPTKTMLPAKGSPAIGKGSGCPSTDQRGNVRPQACTLGAVEP